MAWESFKSVTRKDKLGSFWNHRGLDKPYDTAVMLRVRLARRKTGLNTPVKYFTDRSKAVLILWIFYVFFCLAFAMPLCASVYMCKAKRGKRPRGQSTPIDNTYVQVTMFFFT